MNGVWLDGPENSQDEEEDVRKKLVPQAPTLPQKVPPIGVPLVSSGVPPDGFTSFVIECFINTCFNGLEIEPIDTKKDSPEAIQDKIFYQTTKAASAIFKAEELAPLRDKVFYKVQLLVIKYPEMKQFHNELYKIQELYVNNNKNLILMRSAEKNDVATLQINEKDVNRWKCIHNIYHLSSYVGACVLKRAQDPNLVDKTMLEIWKALTGDRYWNLPVSKWDELTGYEFIDNVKELWNTFEKMKTCVAV